MRVDAFDFTLPERLIALRPTVPREKAKLLLVDRDGICDSQVGKLASLLRRGDLLVFNDTKVIPARLYGVRARYGSLAKVEILLHQRQTLNRWVAFAKPAKRLQVGDLIDFAEGFSASVVSKNVEGNVDLEFHGAEDLLAVLARHGEVPLPPYITSKRPADSQDAADYQTIYANEPGAVAAPTAGLHFTPEMMSALDAAGVGRAFVTLHVGAATFLPVKVADTEQHRMHAENGILDAATAKRVNEVRAAGGQVVAVGTTALRLLESAAGEDGLVQPYSGSTRLFITPGYQFRIVDRLLTNFHLPRSTLFMLVSAFVGMKQAREAYEHAIANNYRFYSYGDASLLERAST